MWKPVFTRASTIPKKNADQNPDTSNPGTTLAASIISKAFITSENRPSVRTFIGIAIMFTTGLIRMLIKAMTIAAMIAPVIVTVAPGIM